MKKLSFALVCFFMAGMQAIWAQEGVVSGRTTDGSTGEILAGVAIQVKGAALTAITQADGTYTIDVPSGSTTLVFSMMGYQTREVDIAGRSTVDVVMAKEMTALDEIVVTGYTVERKKDIIGSVSVVNPGKMLAQASGAASGMLQGLATGIMVAGNGSMDGVSKLRIHGFHSFGFSDPLCIIDGVPGDIDRLNPYDIASVQVLKDAASAAIYGARAANGVIVITTRTGKQGAVKVALDAYTGIRYISPDDFPEMADAQEWGEIFWKSMAGAGRVLGDENWTHRQYGSGPTPVIPEYILVNDNGSRTGGTALEALKISDPAAFVAAVDPASYDYATHQIVKSANTDWFDEVFNHAPVTNIQLSASGGSDNGTYLISLNYYNTRAIEDVDHSYLTRYTLRTNTTFNIRNIVRLGENLQLRYNEGRSVGRVAEAWTMPALMPVWDIAGYPAGSAAQGIIGVDEKGRNPIGEAWHNRFDRDWTYGLFGNVFAEVTPINDLTLRSSFGLDVRQTTSKNLTQVTYEHADNTSPPNSLNWNMSNPRSWSFTNTLTYSRTIGRHTSRILLGTEAIDDYTIGVNASRENFLIDDNDDFLVLDSGTGTQTGGGSFSHNTLFSLFGRLDYSFADKYLINGTVRRDGSSRFGANNKYGNFMSLAIGWRISDEKFMQGLSWLTDLKLRAGYGITGNQGGLTNENQYTTYVQDISNSYPIQGANTAIAQSYMTARLGNPDARWERTVSTSAGFDATLLAGALALDFTFYIRESQDLLVQRPAPYTGANVIQPYVNRGRIRNHGADLTMVHRGRIAGRIDYVVSANYTTYRNKVLEILDDPEAALTGGSSRMGDAVLTKAGSPIAMFYGYRITGFFNSQYEVDAYYDDGYQIWIIPAAVGRWRLQDVNGDKYINDHDRTLIGSPHPDFQVGLNFDLAYKGFDLTAFLFWSQGGDIFNYSRYLTDFNTYQYQRSDRMLYKSWTTELRDKALLPRLDLNDTYSNRIVTDYFVEDATYLRLRQLSLGYSPPQSILNVIRIDKLRIYVSAQNLFTLSKYSGLDPAISIQGSDLSMGISSDEIPTPKQVILGIDLGF